MSFAERLKEKRITAGYKQKEIAALMNIGSTTFNSYEKGVREPDFEKVATICRILNCSADYLLGIPTPPVDPVLAAYREAPPVLQAAICDMLHVAPPASSMSSVSTFVPGGGYERKEKSRG